MPEEKRSTGIYLIRVGEREDANNSESGLSKSSREYIAKLVRIGFARFPFDRVFCTPSPVARETVKVFLCSAPEFILNSLLVIEEKDEIFSDRVEWERAILAVKPAKDICNLWDLVLAEEAALERGLLPEKGFILEEGERIFNFLAESEKSLRPDATLACFMHSPLPEAVILWALKSKSSFSVKQVRPFTTFSMLDYLDAYIMIFREGELDVVMHKKYKEKVESPAAENIKLIRSLLQKR